MADDVEECAEKNEKILLFLSNNEIFVWDKETVMKLRRKYHIVGSLVGSLPSKPRQNLVFSLPLALLPEEARLLIDKNIARIVKSDIARPSQESIAKFRDERKASIRQQIEKLEEIKQQKLEEFAEIIEEGREKTNRKRKILSQDSIRKQSRTDMEGRQSCIDSSSEQIGDEGSTSKQTRKQSYDSRKETNDTLTTLEGNSEGSLQDSTLVRVSTQSEFLRTKDATWKFPETETEELRCKVFSDLWEKGYYLTNGNKFGGDYLVYPGDPLRYHSHFIVKTLPMQQRLTGLDFVSVGRLGSTVNKTSVLASVDSSGKVIYTSVQWSGFS